MRQVIGIAVISLSALASACDEQRPPIAECIDGWRTTTAVRDGSTGGHSAGPVLALENGDYVYGFAQHAVVSRLRADGSFVWGSSPEPFLNSGIAGLALAPDGRIIVAAPVFDDTLPSMSALWVGAFTADGAQQWYTTVGPAHYEWGASADVLVHPDGGYVVSWHDSQAEGADPQLRLARLDDGGAILWSTEHPLAPDSDIGQWWAEGAAGLLPDGSIVQVTLDGDRSRLVHTAADGTLVSDAVIDDVEGWPMDLLVLPDGGVLVAANHTGRAMLLEVDPAGAVLQLHEYGDSDPFFGSMAWDPVLEVLYLGGTDRDTAGQQRPWTLLVDREGDVLASYLDPDGGDWFARGAVARPDGGFVASRDADALLLETTTPCDEE